MQDINSGVVVGRLAADPELRSLNSGTSVCQLRLAFNTSRKDASGEWGDKGNFIDVKVWGKQGEACARNLAKGRRIGVSYRIEVEEWETDQGHKRSKAVLVADRVQYLDPKDQDGSPSGGQSNTGSGSAQRSTPAVDDDIPF